MTNSTERMLYLLPTWMEMVQNKESNGAKFLDVVGLEMEYARDMLSHFINDTKIGTIDVSQIDIIYKATYQDIAEDLGSLDVRGFLEGNERALNRVTDIAVFYESSDPDIYIGYEDDNVIYLRSRYDYLYINGTTVEPLLHHVWNALDEVGLLLAIPRFYGEKNAEYYTRLLRALDYPRDGTEKSARANIEIELGINKNEAEMHSLSNAAFQNTLLDDEGNPSKLLISYANQVNHYLAQTWDTAIWDKSYWVSVNDSHLGFNYIPHIWSVPEKLDPSVFKSGVHGEEDLAVFKPSMDDEQEVIEYIVGLQGQAIETKRIYPERRFKFKLYATGKVIDVNANPEEYFYTIVAAPKIPLNIQISASKTFTQNNNVGFSSTDTVIDYTQRESATDTSYVYNGGSESVATTLIPGDKINHPSNAASTNYLKIKIDFNSNEVVNPVLQTVSLTYNNGTATRTINLIGASANTAFTWSDNVLNIGWSTNNLEGSTGAAVIMSNTEFDGDNIRLVTGSYDSTFDSTSEWMQSTDYQNIAFTNDGIQLNL